MNSPEMQNLHPSPQSFRSPSKLSFGNTTRIYHIYKELYPQKRFEVGLCRFGSGASLNIEYANFVPDTC